MLYKHLPYKTFNARYDNIYLPNERRREQLSLLRDVDVRDLQTTAYHSY